MYPAWSFKLSNIHYFFFDRFVYFFSSPITAKYLTHKSTLPPKYVMFYVVSNEEFSLTLLTISTTKFNVISTIIESYLVFGILVLVVRVLK